MINIRFKILLKRLLSIFISTLIFFSSSTSNLNAEALVYSYGSASINNTNGFLVSQIENEQVFYPFIPGHIYRIDISGAVNPNTFWVGICNDNKKPGTNDNICNPSARNYTNDGDFSITFTNIDSTWFDVWGNCQGFGLCSITGLKLFDLSTDLPAQPKITIINNVLNDNGGTLTTSDFVINIGGSDQTARTINADENGIDVELNEGIYDITESNHVGYGVSYSSDCSGTILAGEEKECVITNNDIAPTITLIKEVVGGTSDVNAFGMSLNGNIVSSGVPTEVTANLSITINESGLENYEFVSITGNGCPSDLDESVILLPGENITCIITNKYIVPVTKVFVIPGLGASWNLDAFVNCKLSGYGGSWNLAPYAESVYNPILEVLPSKGWTVIPFYYDWRKDVRENSQILKDLINSRVVPEEKVNIVGHSMGGLVTRNYLETQSGGKAAKFLAVGTPNKGSSFAYPVIAGGEVWTDNLMIKIASTLFLNRCGTPDSIYNLLPTYNYLKDIRTGQIKDVGGMTVKNSYLPTNFDYSSWNVKIGTLIGTGTPTLKLIDVIKDPKWTDGKPIKKEFVNEGDGTVLVDSAQIDGVSGETINQSHSGVIASDEAIDKILKFLGSPGIDDPEYREDKSALILIGYPNGFSITDQNGKVTTSKDGMIAIMDPESGDYKLKFDSGTTSTDFIIAQFLSNGQTEYKEYKFKGNVREKVIKFNSKKTQRDILHDINEYQKPHFFVPKLPKFWFGFWNFWNKFRKR